MTEAGRHGSRDYIIRVPRLPARKRAPYNENVMLDDRAKFLLKALVERYIAEGQPVGSRTLSRASGLELSPATIRNVMSDLEELGLIASPHTSRGPHPHRARLPPVRGHHAHRAARTSKATCASTCRPTSRRT